MIYLLGLYRSVKHGLNCSNELHSVLIYLCGFGQAHLIDGRGGGGGTVDSARQNLAATFVNAFVNAGFGQVCIGSCLFIGK